MLNINSVGGTVAQAAALTMYGHERPRGHRFESDRLSFPDPTPHLFSSSFPVKTFTILSD